MKLIIAGSRSFDHRNQDNYCLLVEAVIEAGYASKLDADNWADHAFMGPDDVSYWPSDKTVTEVVSGGAKGVDRLGIDWAVSNYAPYRVFKPDWKQYGRRAGILRNEEMGRYADALVALWDGQSAGTRHMIDFMRSLGKPVYVKVAPREGAR